MEPSQVPMSQVTETPKPAQECPELKLPTPSQANVACMMTTRALEAMRSVYEIHDGLSIYEDIENRMFPWVEDIADEGIKTYSRLSCDAMKLIKSLVDAATLSHSVSTKFCEHRNTGGGK